MSLTPDDVPEELTSLALAGIADRLRWASLHWGTEGVHPDAWPHVARAALGAALPAIEDRLREQIAQEIRDWAERFLYDGGCDRPIDTEESAYEVVYDLSYLIARGQQSKAAPEQEAGQDCWPAVDR